MNDPDLQLGLAVLAGIVIGWCLRGARVDHDNPPPRLSPQAAQADAELQRLLRAGEKIGAIKHYRRLTGCRLADAKAAIEALLTQR